MEPWGMALAVLVGATLTESGRKVFRAATKQIIKVGYQLSDQGSGVVCNLMETTTDLIAEVRAEQADKDSKAKIIKSRQKAAYGNTVTPKKKQKSVATSF